MRNGGGEEFRLLVKNAPDVIVLTEADGTVRYVSPSISRVLGYRPEEFVGKKLAEYLHSEAHGWSSGGSSQDDSSPVVPAHGVMMRLRHADGSWRRVEALSVDLPSGSGTRRGYYLHDVTERKAIEEDLTRRAFHDPLTGLANRALFMNRLEHALSRTPRQREAVAVLFLDLDNFKAVNDSLGHAAGDRLLVVLGKRVQACVRPSDTVARLGGDEFAVLIEETARDAERVAERIREVLREPLDLEGRKLRVCASLGIAISTDLPGNERPEDLLRAADASMYRAKSNKAYRASRDGFEAMSVGVRAGLEDRLRSVIEREEFDLHYLAAATPGNRTIACMEALLRWETPELSGFTPQEIVGLAERSDLMGPLERWIVMEACRQALLWRRMWPGSPPLVSVNVSARQFRRGSLYEEVGTALRETDLSPDALVLEIAEEALMDGDAEEVAGGLSKLKDLGVKLAVDGFAPGNAELPDLERLPIDFLKLERSLVRKLGRGRKNAGLLVSLYTGLAQSRGIGVVAEGVESVEQLEALEKTGCDLVQGFYLWEPLPGLQATELLRTNLGSPLR